MRSEGGHPAEPASGWIVLLRMSGLDRFLKKRGEGADGKYLRKKEGEEEQEERSKQERKKSREKKERHTPGAQEHMAGRLGVMGLQRGKEGSRRQGTERKGGHRGGGGGG